MPHCCGEAGTLVLSRPDIAAMRARRRDARQSVFHRAKGKKVVLTNCVSCLSGLGRNGSSGFKARHLDLAEELAIGVDGEERLGKGRGWRHRASIVDI